MEDAVSPKDFHQAEGAGDWRVVGDGACAFFRTGSFVAGSRFVQAIGELDGIEEHAPDIDLRPSGVTVRLLTYTDDYYGVTRRDIEMARRISALAREQRLEADTSKVQSVLVVPGAANVAEVMPFWQAVLGYERRLDSPAEDLVDPNNRWPALWFERMKELRGDGGGALHIAVWLPPELAEARVAAALAAGGHVVRDDFAPMWWTLADAAGNEADISSVAGRGG